MTLDTVPLPSERVSQQVAECYTGVGVVECAGVHLEKLRRPVTCNDGNAPVSIAVGGVGEDHLTARLATLSETTADTSLDSTHRRPPEREKGALL